MEEFQRSKCRTQWGELCYIIIERQSNGRAKAIYTDDQQKQYQSSDSDG
jgi:hypothetical protein